MLDCTVNVVCLFLMTKLWKPIYVEKCGALLKCVVRTPCLGCASPQDLELIERVEQQVRRDRARFEQAVRGDQVQSLKGVGVGKLARELLNIDSEELVVVGTGAARKDGDDDLVVGKPALDAGKSTSVEP